MSNHLIIGLGGTGGKVLREFRRRLYEEYSTENLQNPKEGEYFDYVYVDSSEQDLNEPWKTMAANLSLGDSQKVNIHSVPNGMLNNLKAYPGLDAFVNEQDVAEMNARIGQSITAGIGGQRRRLGRILLASNLADINNNNNFEHAIRSAVGRLQQSSGLQNVTFHICAGLAGGTGSGTIIDVISLIRKWFPYDPNSHNNKILLMLYVPESIMVHNNYDAGYYQANGYAALQEINALALGQYTPLDITGKLAPSGEHARIKAGFEAAYIYSNVTENGIVKDLQNRLPSDVAEFLLQSISTAGGQLQRLTDCENNPPTPESDHSGNPAHSCQFMTFGITRVEYPEVEIRQYATYSFALQAVKGILYNQWKNGLGYDVIGDNQVGLSYSTNVRETGIIQRLRLTDDYLTLSQPISDEGTNTWQSIKNTWGKFSENAVTSVERNTKKKEDWPNKLSSMMREFYEMNFRNMGVKRFYDSQAANTDAYTIILCQHIENELFNEWMAGKKSIIEVDKFIIELIDACKERAEKYDTTIANEVNESRTYATLASEVNEKYNNISKLGLRLKAESLLHQYKDDLEKHYRHETMVEAFSYAKTMMMQIINRLSTLSNTINNVKEHFLNIAKDAEKEIANRCKEVQPNDGIYRLYNVQEIRSIVRQFVLTKQHHIQTISAIRNGFISLIGNEGHETFSLLKDKVDPISALNIILEVCEQKAISVMNGYGIANPSSKLIDVNILEKIRNSFNNQNSLKEFIKGIISNAECNFEPDATQSATVTTTMPQMIQLRIPNGIGDADIQFRQQIINTFEQTTNGFNAATDVAESDKNNRIVVVCAKSNIPLRVMRNTAVLKEKYDNLVSPNNQNNRFNKLLLHTESFKTDAIPQLFNLTPDEIKRMAFEPLLIAFALELLPKEYSQMLGQDVYTLQEPTSTGNIPHALGPDFSACWKALSASHKLTVMLTTQVNQEMTNSAVTQPQKDDIASKIKDVLQKHILPSLCNNDPLHNDWALYNREAATIINNRLK